MDRAGAGASGPRSEVATLVLPPEPAAVSRARAFVRTCCQAASVDADQCDTAVLLTSETVTNAFTHGRSEARLAVTIGAGSIWVEVGDDNSRHPRLAEPDADALDGRGLAIVDMLAAGWGVRDDHFGKTVWFEVRLTSVDTSRLPTGGETSGNYNSGSETSGMESLKRPAVARRAAGPAPVLAGVPEPTAGQRAAQDRDVAASVRDEAAELRAAASPGSVAAHMVARDRALAASDREAAALDRQEAALDRRVAAASLQNAYHDDLTGVLMRHAGTEQLSQAVDRAHRTGEPLVLAVLDVDQLKAVNDAHGRAAGDRLLREVGSSLLQGLRSYDVVVRYGGDEFVCALLGSRLAEAKRRFTDIDQALSTASSGASVSVGLAELRKDENLQDVIGRADREMYDSRGNPPGSDW